MIVPFVLVVYILHSTQGYAGFAGPDGDKIVACYYTNWAIYRNGAGSFDVSNIDASLCSHLIYAYVGLDENSSEIKILDPKQDLDEDGGKGGFKTVAALKEQYKHLKTIVAIGGWNEGSTKYSKMAADPRLRSIFVKSVVKFLTTHKFDGLDLHWDCPTKRGGIPEDKTNYVSLIKELSEAFEPKGFILIGSLKTGPEELASIYDLVYVSFYLDFMHIIAYDYHGPWNRVVGPNAPLHGNSDYDVLSVIPGDTTASDLCYHIIAIKGMGYQVSNQEYSVKHLLANGVTPSKIILDIPTHGRTFIFKNPGVKNVVFGETETELSGFASEFSGSKGFIGYNEVCLAIANKSSLWHVEWHEPSSTPYLWDNERFVSYDNPRSIANKVKFAMDHGLAGLAAWSITTDDFRGECDDELDTYRDYVKRYNKISDQPLLKEALVNLQKVNTSEFYDIKNEKVRLRLPQRKFLKFPLLRTIHDATNLALEEAKVLREMQRLRGQTKSSSCTRTCTEVCYYAVDYSQANTINKEQVF